MSRKQLRRVLLVAPLMLASLAGCRDAETTAPMFVSGPVSAQGVNGIWTVNVLTDPGDGVCDDANCTLRDAIVAAAAGDQVVFANGLQGTITLTGTFVIDADLSIDGGGRITLDANGGGRAFHLNNQLTPGSISVTLAGLTLQNGATNNGGGILVNAFTTATIRNVRIHNNTVFSDGGGMWIDEEASVTLINSTVDDNSAGATAAGGGIYSEGTLVIIGSTVSHNSAEQGGGIYNSSTGVLSLVRSTISGNLISSLLPAEQGGGIQSYGLLNLQSTTVTKNELAGLVMFGGSSTVANSIIAGGGTACAIVSGTQTSLGNNLADTNGCQFTAAGDKLVNQAQVFTQVLEQDLKDNGGPTMTHALIARGLAVDAGYCPGETTDQRGFTRPVDDPVMPNVKDGCDMGAYEIQGPLVAVADLMVSQTVSKSSVKQGELLTYFIRVQNLGPQTAPNVVVNNLLSSGVTFFDARSNKGAFTAPPRGETGTVTWTLGDMLNQANEVAEIQVTVLVRGKTTITNTASVSGDVADPNTANNSAAITVTVMPGKAGGKG